MKNARQLDDHPLPSFWSAERDHLWSLSRSVDRLDLTPMRFSTREDCLVPVPRSHAQASDGTAHARSRQPAACFASISDALQQVQHNRSPWAQDSHPAAAQAAGIVEPKTGLEYQPEYCQRGRSQCGQLAGVGCAPSDC